MPSPVNPSVFALLGVWGRLCVSESVIYWVRVGVVAVGNVVRGVEVLTAKGLKGHVTAA